jgi:hypothetical protein
MPFIKLTGMVCRQLGHFEVEVDIKTRVLIIFGRDIYKSLTDPRVLLGIQPIEDTIPMRAAEIGQLTGMSLEALVQIYNRPAFQVCEQLRKDSVVMEIIPLHFCN